MLARSFCIVLCGAFAFACSDSDAPDDASTPVDASVRDATVGRDATAPDLGRVNDAGGGDSGIHPDAATEDSGAPADLGLEPDAAELPDSGEAPDAGEESDAGEEPDAGTPNGCELGQATSTATTSNLDLFGTPAYFNGGAPVPAGTYRITYVDGCMKYSGNQGWTVNAYAGNQACWYVVGASTSERIVVPPGTIGYAVGSGAYADFEDCVNASLQIPPVEFTLSQPTPLGVWLLDSPYADNVPGIDNRNPTWRLSVVTSTCPQ